MKPLNVLMVSTSYPSDLHDWRGLFIRHLADALAARADLEVSLWAPPGEVHSSITRICSRADDAWLERLVQRGGIAQLLRARKLSGVVAAAGLLLRLRNALRKAQPDVYHINWLQNALALPDDARPALITVLGSDMRILGWPGVTTMMRRICRGRRVLICPNAEWMVPKLSSVFGDVAAVAPVAFGIDPQWYELRRRPQADLPPKWLVVARVTRDKIGALFEWGDGLFDKNRRTLDVIGPRVDDLTLPDWVNFHGPASPLELSTRWFPQAHGLITLSQHAEGRPQVMLEAMAAGLPIIATRLPAHKSLLDHRRTGWFVDDAATFAQGLAALESIETNLSVGVAAREYVRTTIGTWSDCADRYVDCYRALVAETMPRG